MKITKLILYGFTIMLMTSTVISLTTNSKLGTNMHFGLLKKNPGSSESLPGPDLSQFAPKNLTAEDLPDVPIYYQGWIKYFNYFKKTTQKTSKPRFFFKNEAFIKQNIGKNSTNSTDDDIVNFYFLLVFKLYLVWIF